jgi:hypothetical protein
VKAKFNGSQSAWAESAVSRLVSWKLNTLGAWCDSVSVTKGMPYTRALGLGKDFDTWARGMFPDVFNPAWETRVKSLAMAGCSPYRNDPLMIGYFLDNEVPYPPIRSVCCHDVASHTLVARTDVVGRRLAFGGQHSRPHAHHNERNSARARPCLVVREEQVSEHR